MKKLAGSVLSVLLLLVCSFASAQDTLAPEAAALFQSVLPSHSIALWDQCGYTAAAVLTDGQAQSLCVAEQKNGTWELTVCNHAALRKDEPVTSVLLDTDEALFWSYGTYSPDSETYHAVRTDGQWRMTGMMRTENHGNGNISEAHLQYHEGRLHYSTYLCDENENIQSACAYTPVPAAWLNEWMPLSRYDDSRFPKPDMNYTHSWLSEEAAALAAAELFPGDLFLGGCANRDHLEFFLQKPNGDLIIASCRLDEQDGWQIARSTPLPQGTAYGRENFSSSLVIGDLLVSIGPVDAGTCGVTLICNTADSTPGEPMFSLGRRWISGEAPNGYSNCFGDHPWSDITVMDWNSLPHSLEEALSTMDTAGWAVVSNPNPADRLHLRVKPDRGAKSLGKYYNGTPVRILEQKGNWARVDIFGITGWMMKEYLAFGNTGHAVEAVFPSRVAVNPTSHHYVYAGPDRDQPAFCASCENVDLGLLVLAVVDDDWYHAWFPGGDRTGYVEQKYWYEGNG